MLHLVHHAVFILLCSQVLLFQFLLFCVCSSLSSSWWFHAIDIPLNSLHMSSGWVLFSSAANLSLVLPPVNPIHWPVPDFAYIHPNFPCFLDRTCLSFSQCLGLFFASASRFSLKTFSFWGYYFDLGCSCVVKLDCYDRCVKTHCRSSGIHCFNAMLRQHNHHCTHTTTACSQGYAH